MANPPRKCIANYRCFVDERKINNVCLSTSGDSITFVIAMPKSWSKKKKDQMRGKPYLQRIGLNNLAKGIFDAVFGDDSVAWSFELKKYWGAMKD